MRFYGAESEYNNIEQQYKTSYWSSSSIVIVLLHTALFYSNYEIFETFWKFYHLEFFWNLMKFLKVLKFYENFEFFLKKVELLRNFLKNFWTLIFFWKFYNFLFFSKFSNFMKFSNILMEIRSDWLIFLLGSPS